MQGLERFIVNYYREYNDPLLTSYPLCVCPQVWHCLIALGVSCLDVSCLASRVSNNRPSVFIEEQPEYDT